MENEPCSLSPGHFSAGSDDLARATRFRSEGSRGSIFGVSVGGGGEFVSPTDGGGGGGLGGGAPLGGGSIGFGSNVSPTLGDDGGRFRAPGRDDELFWVGEEGGGGRGAVWVGARLGIGELSGAATTGGTTTGGTPARCGAGHEAAAASKGGDGLGEGGEFLLGLLLGLCGGPLLRVS